ncbi:MAG: alpha-galactosidase [Mycobacterium sp.]|nr:alpha-galactosidase [Mycobacterium sp.]
MVGAMVGGAMVWPKWSSPTEPDGLAQTPPMGFNNWTATYCNDTFGEAMVKSIADVMVAKGLKDLGYEYVNIDDCWALPERGSDGNLVPDPVRFPHGVKALADYVHQNGLKFGIYTSAGTKTCDPHGFPGSLDHEVTDANQFAAWGVDFVKYDNCNNQSVDAEHRYLTMRNALKATGRPILLSLCEWGQNKPWLWAVDVGHMWRTGSDIADNWAGVLENLGQTLPLAQYAGPGHWNDPDLLQMGNGGMTDAQYRSQFSLWSIMAAPLIVGSDLRNATPETLAIITNADVIAVDQDPLGRAGHEVKSTNGRRVIVKPLQGGDQAVALFNQNDTDATIDADLGEMGFDSGLYVVKDLWSKATHQATGNTLSASVPAYSTALYRISPVRPRAAGRWNLSELVELRSSNGWGPFETDRSNGDQAIGDGQPMTLRGARFKQGLGVNAPSEIDYYLGGTCSTFTTSVGVDDDAEGHGSVKFQIYVDDALVGDSGLMTGTMPAKSLSADLSHADTLKLVVQDGGDGIEFDHGDWAEPTIDCA